MVRRGAAGIGDGGKNFSRPRAFGRRTDVRTYTCEKVARRSRSRRSRRSSIGSAGATRSRSRTARRRRRPSACAARTRTSTPPSGSRRSSRATGPTSVRVPGADRLRAGGNGASGLISLDLTGRRVGTYTATITLTVAVLLSLVLHLRHPGGAVCRSRPRFLRRAPRLSLAPAGSGRRAPCGSRPSPESTIARPRTR